MASPSQGQFPAWNLQCLSYSSGPIAGARAVSRSSSSVAREFQEIGPWAVGRSLREVLAEGERPDRAALIDWGIQLLEILAEAHAEGLLHGHLTEDEVFLVPAGLLLTGF